MSVYFRSIFQRIVQAALTLTISHKYLENTLISRPAADLLRASTAQRLLTHTLRHVNSGNIPASRPSAYLLLIYLLIKQY